MLADAMNDLITEKIQAMKKPTPAKIRKMLDDLEIPYREDTEEMGYFDIQIPVKDADGNKVMVRIYKVTHGPLKGTFKVQLWVHTEYHYSGIPTFMPSGRDTFGDWF